MVHMQKASPCKSASRKRSYMIDKQ